MIRQVRIKGYKSLRDVEVALNPLTVIVGPNAVGKSNLFDALGLLSRMVNSKTLAEAFAEHRGAPLEAFSVGQGGVRDLLSAEKAQFSMEVDVQLSDSVVTKVDRMIREMRRGVGSEEDGGQARVRERFLRYCLTVEMLTDSGHLRVVDEKLCALNKDGSIAKSRKPFLERVGNELRLRMERQSHPFSYELGLNYTIVSTPVYPPHYPHVTAFREELSRWRFYYLEPTAMRKDSDLKEVESLSSSGEDLAAYYNTLERKHPKKYEALRRSVSQLLPAVHDVQVEKTDQGLLRLSIFEGGVPFSARVISEGTLRVLGLLAITKSLTPLSVVGYEEPENGVHPRRLKLIADMLNSAANYGDDVQFIINTHSPILPEYFDHRNLLLCRREDLSTQFSPLPVGGLFSKASIDGSLWEGEEPTSYSERVVRGDFGG